MCPGNNLTNNLKNTPGNSNSAAAASTTLHPSVTTTLVQAAQGASLLIVPGWRGSGPGHWQSLWAQRLPQARRVEQDDWVTPTRNAWVGALEQAVLAAPEPVVIIAHSLGCIATVHMGAQAAARVNAVLLVAPANPERRPMLNDFAPTPSQPLPYRSILVASRNDPYCSIRLAGAYARSWGSELVSLQQAGHINIASGHGEWPLGLALLQALLQEVAVV